MALAQSRLTAQGQVSVPAKVRRKLGIAPGAVLEWSEEGGKIVVSRLGGYTSEDVHEALFGARVPARRTLRKLKEGVRRYVKTRHARG